MLLGCRFRQSLKAKHAIVIVVAQVRQRTWARSGLDVVPDTRDL